MRWWLCCAGAPRWVAARLAVGAGQGAGRVVEDGAGWDERHGRAVAVGVEQGGAPAARGGGGRAAGSTAAPSARRWAAAGAAGSAGGAVVTSICRWAAAGSWPWVRHAPVAGGAGRQRQPRYAGGRRGVVGRLSGAPSPVGRAAATTTIETTADIRTAAPSAAAASGANVAATTTGVAVIAAAASTSAAIVSAAPTVDAMATITIVAAVDAAAGVATAAGAVQRRPLLDDVLQPRGTAIRGARSRHLRRRRLPRTHPNIHRAAAGGQHRPIALLARHGRRR